MEQLLGESARAALAALLDESLQFGGSANASKFRADRYEVISAIELLEAKGLIKRSNDRYAVSALALPVIETENAKRISEVAERIYSCVRGRYFATQATPLEVIQLAQEANLPLDEAIAVLSLMVEVGVWSVGHSIDLTQPGAYVVPGEGTLKYSTFAALTAAMSTWRSTDDMRSPEGAAFLADHRPLLPQSVHLEDSRPSWFDSLPDSLRDLLREIYCAVELDLRALASMGARTAIDIVLVEKVGDIGGFDRKLSKMVSEGHLTQAQSTHIGMAIEAGSAAAHRGHVPDNGDLRALLTICENLIYQHLVMPNHGERLKINTPSRRESGR